MSRWYPSVSLKHGANRPTIRVARFLTPVLTWALGNSTSWCFGLVSRFAWFSILSTKIVLNKAFNAGSVSIIAASCLHIILTWNGCTFPMALPRIVHVLQKCSNISSLLLYILLPFYHSTQSFLVSALLRESNVYFLDCSLVTMLACSFGPHFYQNVSFSVCIIFIPDHILYRICILLSLHLYTFPYLCLFAL